MAGSVNKVIIVGRLIRDGETRNFQNGGKVFNMTVATSDKWKDKNSGEQKEKSEFHNVALFSEGLVRVAEQYLRKGSTVYIEGKLATRKWQDQSGNDKYSTEIVVQGFDGKLVMLGGKPDGQGHSQPPEPSGGGYEPQMDDEIPF